MKNIYEYADEAYKKLRKEIPYNKVYVKQYYGKIDELEDFIDVLEVIDLHKQLGWTLYSDKEDDDFVYLEVWQKNFRDINYKEDIRRSVDMETEYDEERRKLHEMLDSIIYKKRFTGESNVEKLLDKINQIKQI